MVYYLILYIIIYIEFLSAYFILRINMSGAGGEKRTKEEAAAEDEAEREKEEIERQRIINEEEEDMEVQRLMSVYSRGNTNVRSQSSSSQVSVEEVLREEIEEEKEKEKKRKKDLDYLEDVKKKGVKRMQSLFLGKIPLEELEQEDILYGTIYDEYQDSHLRKLVSRDFAYRSAFPKNYFLGGHEIGKGEYSITHPAYGTRFDNIMFEKKHREEVKKSNKRKTLYCTFTNECWRYENGKDKEFKI